MSSPTQWTWVSASSGSWWWTGKPGVLQSMWSQRVGHNWATELIWFSLLRRRNLQPNSCLSNKHMASYSWGYQAYYSRSSLKKKKTLVLHIMNFGHNINHWGQSHLLMGTVALVALRRTGAWRVDWLFEELVAPLWTNEHVCPDSHVSILGGVEAGWWLACCTLTAVLLQCLRPPGKLKIIRTSMRWNKWRMEERELSVQSKCCEKMKGLKWTLFAIKGHKPLRGDTCFKIDFSVFL